MKKILILALILALLVPVTAMAAGTGGSANRYELRCDRIQWHYSGTSPKDSTSITLSAGSTGFGIIGALPDTSIEYDATDIVCPMGAGAFMTFSALMTAAAGDSAGIQIQWSPDGTNWFGSNTVAAVISQVPSVGLVSAAVNLGVAYNVVVEAATNVTTPTWKKVRFLAQHWDGGSVTTAITAFQVWWCRYVKVDY